MPEVNGFELPLKGAWFLWDDELESCFLIAESA
jgi:hypothetical protein